MLLFFFLNNMLKRARASLEYFMEKIIPQKFFFKQLGKQSVTSGIYYLGIIEGGKKPKKALTTTTAIPMLLLAQPHLFISFKNVHKIREKQPLLSLCNLFTKKLNRKVIVSLMNRYQVLSVFKYKQIKTTTRYQFIQTKIPMFKMSDNSKR